MASSPLRSLILRLARLALIGPVGRFIVEVILDPNAPMEYLPPSSPTNGEEGLQVIACGFSRSGTFSLKLALERLGFKCYHGADLHYSDWGFGRKDHAKLWLQAATEEKWDNWQQILHGYTAIAGYPAACFYKRLMAAYPKAKVIMNVRDPGQWHRSCMETVFWAHNKLTTQVFRRDNVRKVMDVALWQGEFEGRFEEKEFSINVYKSHVEEVKRIVPKEKLLVYEVKEGWAPLCGFLKVQVPFPRRNDTLSYRSIAKKRERAYVVFSAVYVGLLSCALAIPLRWVFQLCVGR